MLTILYFIVTPLLMLATYEPQRVLRKIGKTSKPAKTAYFFVMTPIQNHRRYFYFLENIACREVFASLCLFC
ncbi:hypothetical protein F5Y04DRAFT_254258 [Hypomontagnella monticulosa]|nr:hypothetical protein F5Y04DRAFT_254258 [Hypomontagnella monticulosa]